MIVVERFVGQLECVETAVYAYRTHDGKLVCTNQEKEKVAVFKANEWRGCTRNVSAEEAEKIFAGARRRPSSREQKEAMQSAPFQVNSSGEAVTVPM